MERETVFFSENVPILATLGYPDHGDGPFPGVVLLHGHARHRNDGLDALSKRLNEAGFVTLRFDFRGCGETMYERYNIICHTHCPEDAYNAVSFLSIQPEVDKNRIGVAGESLGGCTTVYAAGSDARVRCAVSMAGLGDIGRNLKKKLDARYGSEKFESVLRMIDEDRYARVRTGHSKWILAAAVGASNTEEAYAIITDNTNDREYGSANSNYMTVAALESFIKYRPEALCADIHIPILYLHAELDELVDRYEAEHMFELTGSPIKEMRIMPGVDHNMPQNTRRQEVFDHVVGWFERYL